jgi:transcription elongation GreA/GreB family factor
VKKAELLKLIVAGLVEHLEVLEKAARASHAEATHESSKAENKYDTRGLEAAYLAGGQAKQIRELLAAIKTYESLAVKDFAPDAPVDLSALVEVQMGREKYFYFIGPKNGGLEIVHEGKEIAVLTPQSPLGQMLMGKRAGDSWTAQIGGSNTKYKVISVK